MNIQTASDKMPPAHPGKITFIDGTTRTVEDASTVPETVRFAQAADGSLVPVVRIVAMTEEDRRIIREYGVDGALLRSTVQIRKK
jgi:hypothetical protein